METREQIRRRLLALRDRLSKVEVEKMSRLIDERLLKSDVVRRAKTVALYSAIRNEVRTEDVFREIRREGKKTCFPRTTAKGIEFAEVANLSELSPGKWGILEPLGGKRSPLEELDLVLVPGVVFAESGHRLGFGKGFYDRALEKFKGLQIGLAYEFQIVEKIPLLEGDLQCDGIVTEKRWIWG